MNLFKSSINVVSVKFINLLTNVLLLPLILLKLTVEEIGILGLIIITSQIMSLGMFGINKAIPRFFSHDYKKKYFYNFNGLWLLFLIINLTLYYFFHQKIWSIVSNGYSNKFSVFLLVFFLKIEIDNYINEWLIANNETKFLRNYKLLETVISALLTLFLLLILNQGIEGRIIALLMPGLLIGFVVIFRLKFYKLRYSRTLWYKYISYSKSLALSSLGTITFNYIDRILILKIIPAGDATYSLGLYEIANKLANVIKAIVNSFGRVVQVKYNKIAYNDLYKADRYANFIKRLVDRKLLLLIIIFNLLSVIGLRIINKFDPIYLSLIPILTFGYWLRLNYIFFINQLLILQRQSLLFTGTLIAGALNIFLNFILIPVLGITGAALTTFISHFFLLVYFYHFTDKTSFKKILSRKYIILFIFLYLIFFCVSILLR